MKLLTLFLLAFALIFRADPLCAAPAAAFPATAMSDCADMADDRDDKHNQQPQSASLACHTCAAPPGTVVAFDLPVQWPAPMPDLQHPSQMAGATIEPPTPPPRAANSESISTFQRS